MMVLLAGSLACGRSPGDATAEPAADEPKIYNVRKDGRLVLTVTDAPGPIVSAAMLPPDAPLAKHPFLSASSHAPEEEDALRRLLDRSTNTLDFLKRLRGAGYDVAPR